MSFHRNKPCAHIDCVSEAHTHILRLREPAPFFACWLLLFLEMTPGTSFTTRLVCVRFRGLFHTCTARRECEYVGGDFFDESTNPSLIKCDLDFVDDYAGGARTCFQARCRGVVWAAGD